MLPEILVEIRKTLRLVRIADGVDLVEQIRMRARRALPEYDPVTSQNVGTLDRDRQRNRAI